MKLLGSVFSVATGALELSEIAASVRDPSECPVTVVVPSRGWRRRMLDAEFDATP